MNPAGRQGPRDALVTGMGFCLPGAEGLGKASFTATRDELWDVIATGRQCLDHPDAYFGEARVEAEDVLQRVPQLPAKFLANYSEVHRYGLVSAYEAFRDAGLDPATGALAEAGLVAARNCNPDPVVDTYLPLLLADPERTDPALARALLFRNIFSASFSDLESVVAATFGVQGPSMTVSCGCASGTAALGAAIRMIGSGEADLVVVTGADYWRFDRMAPYLRLTELSAESSAPQTVMRLDRPMRPYDERADGHNYGNGGVTLVLEARERAQARGAPVRGRILGHGAARGAQTDLTVNLRGTAAVQAARRALAAAGVDAAQIDYVNGGAQGDAAFNRMEANVATALFGDRARGLRWTSQEGCFGHIAAPLGLLGAAATLLMIEHGRVAPTAGCERPDPTCPFDPVPGTAARPARIDLALSLNYTVGSVAGALVLGRDDDHHP